MKIKAHKVQLLIKQLEELQGELLASVEAQEGKIATVCPTYHSNSPYGTQLLQLHLIEGSDLTINKVH